MAEHVSGGLSLDQLAERMQSDMAALHTMEGLSPGLQDMVDSPAPGAMLRQLERFGVTPFVPEGSLSERPEESFSQLMEAGADAMAANGVPEPHLEDYYAAAEIAEQTGIHMGEVLDGFEAVRPQELGALPATESIMTMPAGDTVSLVEPTAALEGVEPQNYQEYDVHLMAVPIPATANLASHGFIVVVPKGTDVSDPVALREGLETGEIDGFVTRAGPDGGLFVPGSSSASPSESSQSSTPESSHSSSQSSDSSVEASGSSSEADADGRTPEGDVYVADFENSARTDLVDGAYVTQSTTVSLDIEATRAEIIDFARDINDADINYYFTSQNSNTYAGDVWEKLTGQEPDPSGWRPLPGIDNDLMDYENTDYGNDFS